MIKYIIIVLGCHINFIQDSRIEKSFEFIKNNNLTTNDYYLFLSGGVKYKLDNLLNSKLKSEGKIMKEKLNNLGLSNENIIVDNEATNSAENFNNFKKYYLQYIQFKEFKELKNYKEKIVITTSLFHYKRAEKILQGIFYDYKYIGLENLYENIIWNLSKAKCHYCEGDELMFMKNVENDVRKALLN